MESPGHCSLLSHPQHSVEHSNRSSPHPATDLHPQLHPKSNESGTESRGEGGGWNREGGGERWRGDRDGLADVHTDLSCQLWIWVVWERKWREKHIEWFRIHLKPVGLERAFMQRNDLSIFAEIRYEQWCMYKRYIPWSRSNNLLPIFMQMESWDLHFSRTKGKLRWCSVTTDEKERLEIEIANGRSHMSFMIAD